MSWGIELWASILVFMFVCILFNWQKKEDITFSPCMCDTPPCFPVVRVCVSTTDLCKITVKREKNAVYLRNRSPNLRHQFTII